MFTDLIEPFKFEFQSHFIIQISFGQNKPLNKSKNGFKIGFFNQ